MGTKTELILLEQQEFFGGRQRFVEESRQKTEVLSNLQNYSCHHAPSLCQNLRSTSQWRSWISLIEILNFMVYKMSRVTSVSWGWCEDFHRHQASSTEVPNTSGPHQMVVKVKDQLGFTGDSVVKNLPAQTEDVVSIPGSGRSPGEEMATHTSILAWKISQTEKLGELQSVGSQKSRT